MAGREEWLPPRASEVQKPAYRPAGPDAILNFLRLGRECRMTRAQTPYWRRRSFCEEIVSSSSLRTRTGILFSIERGHAALSFIHNFEPRALQLVAWRKAARGM